MAVTTPKALYHGQPTSSASTLYTVPSSTVTIIRHIRVVNPDTAGHTVDLWRNGSSDVNRITETISVAAGDSWEDDVYLPLAAADTIQGKADTSSKITVFIGGAEIA
jgi:hypothetical protein